MKMRIVRNKNHHKEGLGAMKNLKELTEIALARRAAKPLTNEKGIVLLTALVLMLLLAVLGTSILLTTTTEVSIARNTTVSTQAFSIAEGGLATAINTLRDDLTWGPDSELWGSESVGSVDLGSGTAATYTITLYDSTGSYGRGNNTLRTDQYVTLSGNDVLIEVTANVRGMERSISTVVRSKIGAFDYVLFSEGTVDNNGTGNNPGKIVGKMYATDDLKHQGNYDMAFAEAESANKITPNCNSGKYQACDDTVEEQFAPILDFSYYQNQGNFSDQQVWIMTPTVGNSTSCGGNCETWNFQYAMQTQGTSYTRLASVTATKSGSTWTNTVSWCIDPTWDGTGNCPDGNAPETYDFLSKKAETSKPFVNALQWNAYIAPEPPYSSSVVNVFDATNHLEFLGPPAGQSATVTSTILVGTASNNTTPIGKIDFEGGAGQLNLIPANGLAVVAEKVKFVAKYSGMTIAVGSPGAGAIVLGNKEISVEGKNGNFMDLTINGSAIAGGYSDPSKSTFKSKGNDTYINLNYVELKDPPAGWSDYGSTLFERREWREL